MSTVTPGDLSDKPDTDATPDAADYDRLALTDAHLRDAAISLAAGDVDGTTAALADAVACLDDLAALDDGAGRLASRLLAIHGGLHALTASRVSARLAALVRDGAA